MAVGSNISLTVAPGQMVGPALMRAMLLSPLNSNPPVNPTYLSKKKKIGHRNLFPFSYDSHLATSILFFSFLFFFSIKSPSSSNDASKVELLYIAIVNNTFTVKCTIV